MDCSTFSFFPDERSLFPSELNNLQPLKSVCLMAVTFCISAHSKSTGEDARGYELPQRESSRDELQQKESTERDFTKEDAWVEEG